MAGPEVGEVRADGLHLAKLGNPRAAPHMEIETLQIRMLPFVSLSMQLALVHACA